MLALVITMSFLFLSLGTLLLSSLTESQARQRRSLYGSWQVFYNMTDASFSDLLLEQPVVEESHFLTILGHDSRCGAVSVWDADFAQMGGLRLAEGRAPEHPGEIVLERGQLSLFREDVSVGSEIVLHFTKDLGMVRGQQPPEGIPDTLTIWGVEVEAQPFYDAWCMDMTSEVAESILESGWRETRYSKCHQEDENGNLVLDENGEPIPYQYFPEDLPDDVTAMTQEQRETVVRLLPDYPNLPIMLWAKSNAAVSNFGRAYPVNGTVGEVSWEVDSMYTVWTVRGTTMSDAELQAQGAVEQKVTVSRTCTVVGILETTADRWDVGEAQVPNSYISEGTQEELYNAVLTLTQSEGPEKLLYDHWGFLNQGQLLFLSGSGSLAQTWEALAGIKANLLVDTGYDRENVQWNYDPEATALSEAERAAILDWAENDPGVAELEPVSLEISNWDVYRSIYFVRETEDESVVDNVYVHIPSVQVTTAGGEQYDVSSGLVKIFYLDEAGEKQYRQISMEEITDPDWTPGPHYTSCGTGLPDLDAAYTYHLGDTLINRYGFPMEQSLTQTMGVAVIGVLMVITVCAVFQIFFTQLKRRVRRLTLLRSIGATNGQIFTLLAWEGLYIILFSLILGNGLGIVLARLLVSRLADTVFYMDKTLFLTGQVCGLLAVVTGMILPSIRAIRAPLVGRMEGKKRRHVKVRPMKRQSWSRLCGRDRAANPGRTLGMLALCVFLIAMELVCIYLGNAAFDTYRRTVVAANRPDYTMTMNYAGNTGAVEPILEKMTSITGAETVDHYRVGTQTFLWYDAMGESPVLKVQPERFMTPQDTDADWKDNCWTTELYTLERDSGILQRLQEAITEGGLNPDAFEKGEEVILLMPMYLEGSVPVQLSLDKNTASTWSKDTSLRPGDTIRVGAETASLTEEGTQYDLKYTDVTVAAIIRYFPHEGVWPFAGDPQSHVVIGGVGLMSGLYPSGFRFLEDYEIQSIQTLQYLTPHNFGQSHFIVYAQKDAPMEQTLSPVTRIAREHGLTLENLRDSNQAVYDKALSSCLLAATMAFAATLIVWMILSNTLRSAQEQSRKRIGVLQALGVTRGQLIGNQAAQAVGYWAVSIVIANVLFFGVVLLSTLVGRWGQGLALGQLVQLALTEDLAAYPWLLHLALCLLQLPVLLIFHLRAVRIPLNHTPMENIRS